MAGGGKWRSSWHGMNGQESWRRLLCLTEQSKNIFPVKRKVNASSFGTFEVARIIFSVCAQVMPGYHYMYISIRLNPLKLTIRVERGASKK